MDGNKEVCEFGEREQNDSEADEPSPYDSDTENVDTDEFIAGLSTQVNEWKIYKMDDLHLEKIGNGFFGEIYKVTERPTNNIVVMKSTKKVTKMKLICAEIRLMCRLRHPNILRFLGICIHDAKINLITKYMNVGNLEEVLLDLGKPLSWSHRMKLAHDISKGMEYLHREGVIHRDLTSKNVLISNENGSYEAVVADFGLAAKIPSRKKRLNVVGSPYWMAPEVIRHDQYNETVDIFSYGIILCETIGRVPSNPDDIPRTNEFGLDVKKFREQVEGCPPEFLQLAVCCCQLEPDSRPPFEITARFLEYIRQLSTIEGSPVKLASDNWNGNIRRSANIEDWLIDKKKVVQPPIDDISPCNEQCLCEVEITTDGNGTHQKINTTDELPTLSETPCKRGRSNKRNSFFAGIRYKYFRPTVVTEDLVKNTPSKLAGFFNRVLHVQKRHKFDRPRKTRSKSTDGEDGIDKPRLRSYRLFGENKDRRASDVPERYHACAESDEIIKSEQELPPSTEEVIPTNSLSTVKFVEPLLESDFVSKMSSNKDELTSRSNSTNSSCTAKELQTTCVSPDPPINLDFTQNGNVEREDPLLMSWPQTCLREATDVSNSLDMNSYNKMDECALHRCQSESNVGTKPRSSKTRSLSTCQQPTKPRKYLSFLNLFRKHRDTKPKT